MIGIEKVGRRIYVTGDTYPIRSQLADAGCTFDRARSQWWIGTAKAPAIEALIARLVAEPPPKEDLDHSRVQAKVEYKGRTYYQIAASRAGDKVRLVTLDGSVDFWGATAECRTLKTYAPREYRGRTEYTTLGSIRRFVAREQANRAAGGAVCAECGTSGELVRDLEDGLLKHRRCCDIEP